VHRGGSGERHAKERFLFNDAATVLYRDEAPGHRASWFQQNPLSRFNLSLSNVKVFFFKNFINDFDY